jgi:hypothetical protein
VHSTKLLTKYEKKLYLKFFSLIFGVVDTADKHSFREYLREFFEKKFKTVLMGYSGAGKTPFNSRMFRYRNMHLVAAPRPAATSSDSCSSAYAETVDSLGSAPPPNTPADFYQQGANNNNNGLFLPPPSHYYAPAPHFLFPPGGVSAAGLPPLTPITPSVDPALGFKNGYIVPQTPNNMTMPQFFQVVQVLKILFNCSPSFSTLALFPFPFVTPPQNLALLPPRSSPCMTPSPHPITPIPPHLSSLVHLPFS